MKYERRNDLNVLVYSDEIKSTFQKRTFDIVHNDQLYHISPLDRKYKVFCYMNIFDYGTLLYLIVYDNDVINCTIFDDQTLDSKTYRIHLKPEHRFLTSYIEGHLIKGKAYLLFKFLHPISSSKRDTTYLIKIPEMKEIKITGEYSSIFTPRFLMMRDISGGYIIIDNENDDIWVQKYHKLYRHSIGELLGKAIRSLKKNGILYRVIRTDMSLSSRFIEHGINEFGVCDYRYSLDNNINYKAFEACILENKKYNAEFYQASLWIPKWKPISFDVKLPQQISENLGTEKEIETR